MSGARDGSHGPTRRERQMLALSEAGLKPDEIAAEMGISADSVRRTLSLLSVSGGDDWKNPARLASEDLLAALRRAGQAEPAPPPGRPLSFEEQLARVAAGARLVTRYRPPHRAEEMTLGGIASALL